jgi:hypothetical protein
MLAPDAMIDSTGLISGCSCQQASRIPFKLEYSVYRYSHTVPACMVHKKICEVEDM